MAATGTLTFHEALQRIRQTCVDVVEADLRRLRYRGGTSIAIGAERYDLAPPAWSKLCDYLALPTDLLQVFGKGFAALAFKCLLNAGRRGRGAPERIRMTQNQKGQTVSVSPAGLAYLTNEEVVDAIQEAWPPYISSETLSVTELRLTESEFEFSCHTQQLSVEPRPGDILNGGITVRHSQAGAAPTQVLSYIHRVVCANGMTQRVCLRGRSTRTKRCKSGNSAQPTRAAVRLQIAQAWQQLEERLDGVGKLLEHPLHVDALPDALRHRWSINRRVADEIAEALKSDELERTYSEYDLVNAMSRVATHSKTLKARYRRQLSLATGMFAQRHVHQCPMCGTWIDGPAARQHPPVAAAMG